MTERTRAGVQDLIRVGAGFDKDVNQTGVAGVDRRV